MLKLGILANRSVEKLVLSGTRITCEGNTLLLIIKSERREVMQGSSGGLKRASDGG